MACVLCIFVASAVDFSSSSIPLTFGPGSANGAEACSMLSADDDTIVEGDEEFTVVLALTTPGPSLIVQNNVTPVVIIDNDGRCIPRLVLWSR